MFLKGIWFGIWKAFEIIVASGVSEEKDAKKVFIKTMIDNGEPCKSEDTAWRIVKSLIKLGLYDAEKFFTAIAILMF